jgi:hypothetical protein
MAAWLVPWTVRNAVQVDEPVMIADGGTNWGSDYTERRLRVAMSPDWEDGIKYFYVRAEPMTLGELVEYYALHPWKVITMAGGKLTDLYISDDMFIWITAAHAEPPLSADAVSRWAIAGNVYYYVVGIAAVLSIPIWRTQRNRGWLVIAWFLGVYTLSHLLQIPQPRYHFAVPAFLCIAAAVTFVTAWDTLGAAFERRRGRAPVSPTIPTYAPSPAPDLPSPN